MTFLEQVEVLGVNGYRFITPREVLGNPKENPDNMCYCTEPGDDLEGCAKTGVFYLAPCRKGWQKWLYVPSFLQRCSSANTHCVHNFATHFML